MTEIIYTFNGNDFTYKYDLEYNTNSKLRQRLYKHEFPTYIMFSDYFRKKEHRDGPGATKEYFNNRMRDMKEWRKYTRECVE